MKLATRSITSQYNSATEHRSREKGESRLARPRHRSSVSFVLVAAVLAVTAVSVAERVEVELTDAADAAILGSQDPVAVSSSPAGSDVLPVSDAPLTSAVLPSGSMALTLRDGGASIVAGVGSPAIELATATIGDLDLGQLSDVVVIAQADTEVSYDWGDVTEWYRTVPEGIEHGYTIEAPISATDDLIVTVDVVDGTPTLVGADIVSISRPGASAVWYRGLIAFDAAGTDLPAEMAVVDGAIELRVDTTGAVYPVTIDPIITDAQVIRDPAGVAGDLLGFAVDVDGNRMVASAPNADGGAGAVLVYDRVDADSPWTLSDRLTRPEPEPNSRFGDSVAVRGDQIAVGESDRLDAEPEAGLVWVFEFDGEDWASFGDPLQQPEPSAGDRFGADIEWVDDFVLAIGAPGADADRGNVFIARFDSELFDWVYDDVVNVLPPEVAPVAGDEFGYAIGYDDSDVGIGALIVGAPGDDQSVTEQDGGAVYRFFRESLSITWNSKGQFLPGRRVGTAVAVSGNRHLIAGYGAGFFEVNAYEFSSEFPSTWASLDGKIVPGAVPVAADGPVNDYLALDGDVIAVGRGGSGGGVSVYRVGDTWPDGPSTDVEPAGREDGDRIGWSLALENGQLTAGAPGDDGAENDAVNSGAIYSVDLNLAAPATFVDTAEFADWSDPANWSGGVVPGPSDSAIVPSGTSPRIDADTVVTLGELVVDDGALFVSGQLQVLGETRVKNSGFLSVDGDGLLTVEETGLLIVENDDSLVFVDEVSELLVRGDIQMDRGNIDIFGRLVIDGDVSISGSAAGAGFGRNQVANYGEVLKTGPGPLVVDSNVSWYSDGPDLSDPLEPVGPPDRFVVEEGSVQIDGSSIVTPDSDGTRNAFPGFLRVGAGAAFEVMGDLVLESTTEIEIGIVGPSEPESNFFGRIIVSGNLTQAGLLRSDVVDYTPVPADAYPIITCGDCGPGAFTTLEIAPFDVVTTETAVTLQTEPPEPPADPLVVTTTADAGPGSLRAALAAANAVSLVENPDPITITFDIPGTGPHTISPETVLPFIRRPMIVDGFSQPGSQPNTAGVGDPINAVIQIELSGTPPSPPGTGLYLDNGSSGSTVRGLAINGFSQQGIQIIGAGGQTVAGNFIGVGPDGEAVASAQQRGVAVSTSANTIGGGTAGDRNLISGNASAGVLMPSATAANNVVRGNFIGTDPTGTVAVPNGFAGVWLVGPGNIVGGIAAAQRNLISGNARGVFVANSAGNVIQGNWIGTDVTGEGSLANGVGFAGQAGVAVQQGATGTLIGGTTPSAGNLIASNNPVGVFVSGAATTGTSILGNRITNNVGLGISITGQDLPVPVITSLVFDGVDLAASGTLTGAVDDYRIELFANDVCDASGSGEGQYFLGSVDISSDDFDGTTAGFSAVISAPLQRSNITATATNSAGSTSTFSTCAQLTEFTNASGDSSWTNPGNWSTGVVPEPTDFVIIPAGSAVVIGSGDNVQGGSLTVRGEVRVEGGLTINEVSRIDGGLLIIEDGGLLTIDAALLVVEQGGELLLRGVIDLRSDAELRTEAADAGEPGLLTAESPAVEGAVFVDGTGQISNLGAVVKTGEGRLGVSPQVTWYSESPSVLDIQEGSVELAGERIQTVDGVDGFPGSLFVAAGTTLDVGGDLVLGDTSVIESEITGPSGSDANSGRVLVAGDLTQDGLLASVLSGYVPVPSDAYAVFRCEGDCSLGEFGDLDVDPFEVVTTQNAVTLQLPDVPPVVPTFTGGSGSWTDPDNWSTGVVPGPTDAVVIPLGSAVVVDAADDVEIGSLTVDGEVRVEGRLTINDDSVVTGLFDVIGGATLVLEATLTVDAPGQLFTFEDGDTPGVIEAGEGARFAGTGLVANSGTVRFSSTGVIPIDPDLTWNSGLDSLIEVLSGTLDIESLSFDTQGRFFIAPGAVLRVQNDFALVATSELEFGIDGPASDVANYGRVELPSGIFTADGTVVLTPTDGFVPAGDVYPLIQCTNGSCLSGDFDVVRGGVVDSRTENAIAFAFVAVNTYTGPATAIAPGDWSDPDGWSSGAVPGIGESAAIPAGKVVELPAGAYAVGALSLAGTLTTQSAGTDIVFLLGDGSVIEPTGQLSFGGTFSCTDTSDPGCVSTNTLSIESDVRVDGLLGVTSSVFLDGLTGESLTSTPTVDVSDPLSLTGDGDVILSAPLVKTGTGTFSIGPDLSFDLASDAVLDVREGLVEIQGPGFVPNGTIQVAPGATVSVTGDLALRPTSTLSFGIDGPSASTDNFGQLELGGELTAAGALRAAIDDGYAPTPSDRYPVISCGFCTGTFDLTDTAPLAVVVRATSISLDAPAAPEPDEPTFGSFAFDASTSSVSVASSGIATSAIPNRTVSGSTGQTGSVASTSLVGLDLNTPVGSNVAASPIASLTIGESVLSAVDVPSALDTLPLTDIDINVPIEGSDPIRFGGWEEILRQIGSEVLQSRPPQNIRFGEIKNFPQVRALRLDQITLAGTPIASLPIASLVLGSTPIASLGTDIDWCDEIAATGSAANCTNSIDPTDTTLVELTLAGIPIASLPIASLPIASLPIASLPIASLPIASLDLASTPIASLPIASLGPAGTPIASLPIASLPIASLEVAGIPIASLPIASLPIASLPIASLPIASLPIASLPVAGTPIASLSPDGSLVSIPIASLDVTGTPIASLPIASLPIASLPIASLPIASLPIASLPIASLPIASLDVRGTPIASLTVDGTLATLPIASLPIASLPIASLPIASLPIASLPIASLPIASLPIASLPIASLPIASLDVTGTPIASLSTDGTLASVPIASLPIASLPIASLPIASLPIASLDAVVDCSQIDCASTNLSLAEALDIAPRPGVTFETFAPLIAGLRWSEVLPVLGLSEAEFVGILADLTNATGGTFRIGDALDFADLTVGELPQNILEQLFLGDLAPFLDGLRLGDLVDLIGPDGQFLDPAAVEAALTAAKNQLSATLESLLDLGDLTLGDIVDENGDSLLGELSLGDVAPFLTGLRFDDLLGVFPGLTENDVRAALEQILRNSTLELGDLLVGDTTFDDLFASEAFGQLTLTELLAAILDQNANALDGITLGDLLLAFVAPSDYPWDKIVFDEIDPAEIPGLVGAVTFDVDFELTGSTRGQSVEVVVTLPDTVSYLPGTARLDGAVLAEPTVVGKVLTWRLTGLVAGTPYGLSFDLQPTLELGSSTVGVEARIIGVPDELRTATSSVAVQQAFEPNDTPATATPLSEDTLYINHVASADDLDFFRIDVIDGQRLVVNLSNLAADFDVVVYGRSKTASILPLVPPSGQSAGAPVPDPVLEPDGSAQVQTELTGAATAFDGLPIVATGNRRGTATETVVTPPLEAGTVYVKVFGANGESSVRAAVLQAKVTEGTTVPECPALDLTGGVPGTQRTIPADANTLILVNQERLSALYPAGSAQPYTTVMSELDELIAYLNGDGANLGIVPGVLDVGLIAGIDEAYDIWDAEPCSSAKANDVVAEITAEITELRQTRNIDHVLIVGGDDIVPMARVTDGATISNQFDYRFTFGGNNAIAGSAWERQVLTDEPYGETAALNYGDRFLYITDTALGRLIDTPAEIAFQLEQFVTSQGRLDPQTGLVMGYDFLDDGSEAITRYLDAAGLDVDDEFGSSRDDDTWTAVDLEAKLFPVGAETPDVISLNAHFDHRRALPALDNTNKTEVDLFEAATVFAAAPGALTGRVTFSMGCHSGLNVSDATIGVLADDFPQAFTRQGGIYVGNTGYGYGDTETVAYSERLMGLFARELVNPVLFDQPTTAGQALQFAKNVFFSELGNVSVYDEKALMEATFYGVPFYRVTSEPALPRPAPTRTTQIDPITGAPSVGVTITPGNEEITDLDTGVKYVNRDSSGDPLELKSPFNPAQPLELIDVSVVDPEDPTRLDVVARGAMVTGLTSTYVSPIDPVIVRPVVDDSATQPEPTVADVVFPVKPTAIRTATLAEGERQILALATGQFSGSSTSGVQRLDDRVDVVVYYAPASETDYTAPTIRSVESFVIDGQLSITADVTDVDGDDPGSGVDRVYVLVAQNPGAGTVEWIGVELAEVAAASGRWVGSVQLADGVTDVQLFAQAKDGAGNIGVSTNKGRNFETLEVDEPDVPTVLDVTIDDVPVGEAGNSWFDGDVVVTAGAGDLPVEYRLNNGPLTPFPTDGLTVSTEGVNRLIITATNGDVVDRVIRIDRTDPTVVIVSPVDGAEIPFGAAASASFGCSDASLVSCAGTLDGSPISAGDDLSGLPPGEYTLVVTARDAVARTTTNTSTFRVTSTSTPTAPPEITLVDGTRAPQSIDDGFTIDIEFTDANFDDDEYTVTIDWGDGDEDSPGTSTLCTTSTSGGATVGNPTCEILASPSADGPGVAVANFRYGAPGVYAITVTVDDGTASSVSVFQFATIYDRGAGRVTGAGSYWSGPEAYQGGRFGRPAFFGYDARYRGNDVVPRGITKLHLLGEFRFVSTSYDYLIINDTFAVAAGTGKFNGRSGYDFRVQGIDNGRVDFFQLTIWNPAGEVVYDNGVKYEGGEIVEAPEGDRVLLGGIQIRR
jgi:hypothetical protein